jgi:hypothetical protein
VKIHASLLMLGFLCAGCHLQEHAASMGASGIVLDSQTRSPIRGALVSVPDYYGKARPVTTGEDGLFSVPGTMRRDWVFIMADFGPPSSTLVAKRDGYMPTNIALAMLQTNFVEVLLTPVSR